MRRDCSQDKKRPLDVNIHGPSEGLKWRVCKIGESAKYLAGTLAKPREKKRAAYARAVDTTVDSPEPFYHVSHDLAD